MIIRSVDQLVERSVESSLISQNPTPVQPGGTYRPTMITKHGETLQAALDAWAASQLAADCCETTVSQRARVIGTIARDTATDPRDLTELQIQRWLISHRGWTKLTYYRFLSGWFKWLALTGRITGSPMVNMKSPRTPRGTPHPIDTDGLTAAIAAASPAMRAWLILAAYAGLRVHEIAKIRGEDVRGGRLYVTGKGDVRASIPIHPLIAELAARYPRRGYWFPSRTAVGHITAHRVSTGVSVHLKRLDVEGTAHWCRHWFITNALRACGNVRVAQELARHASLDTTSLYLLVTSAEQEAAVGALPLVSTLNVAA